MFKLLLTASLLAVSLFGIGQINSLYFTENFNHEKWDSTIGDSNLCIVEKLPAGWEVYDSLGFDYFWHWSDVGPRGHYVNPYNPLEPENLYVDNDYWYDENTIDNGFLMLESDFFNTDSLGFMKAIVHPLSSYVQYGPVDLSDATFPIIEFNSLARVCCDPIKGKLQLLVSTDYSQENTDGATWKPYDLEFIHAEFYSDKIQFDISDQTAGESNVYFRWKQMNLAHYFWMMDDILIYEAPLNEIAMLDYWVEYHQVLEENPNVPWDETYFFNGGYTKIPEYTASKFREVRAAVKNNSSNIQNVTLTSKLIKEGEVINSKTSSGYQIDYLAVDTLIMPIEFELPGVGSYQVSNTIGMDVSDEDNTNNGLGYNFEVTENVYSRVYEENARNFITSGHWEYNYGGIQSGQACTQRFEFLDQVESVLFKQMRFYLPSFKGLIEELQAIYSGNISVIAHIYQEDPDNEFLPVLPAIISSEEYQLNLQDTGSWISLDFLDEGNLYINSTLYYVGVEINIPLAESNLHIGIGVDESAPKQMFRGGQKYNPGDGSWAHSNENYAIELITENQVSNREELSQEVFVYPNPVKDIVYIKNYTEIESIQLYSIDGKLLQQWVGTQKQLLLSNFENGVYVLMVKKLNGDTKIAKVIKE